MAISQYARFENHMDVASPETMGDAEKVSDFFDENPYDDDFEAKLSRVNNIASKECSDEIVEENAKETTDHDSIIAQEKNSGKSVSDLVLNPTRPPLLDLTETEGGVAQESSDILSSGGNNTQGSENLSHHHSIQQVAEKIVATATAVDAVGDIMSGGATAIVRPNIVNIDELSPQTSIVSSEGQHDARSIDAVIEDLGFEINRYQDEIIGDTVVDVGQAIESIGSDEDNQAEFVGEQSESYSEKVIDESDIRSESGGNPPNPPGNPSDISESELKKNIAFRAIADANPDYGVGGGTQYFIQYASDLKRDGRLKQQPSPEILSLDEKEIFKADIRDSEHSKHRIHLDKRNMTEEDVEQMLDSSSDSTSGTLFDMPDSISGDELKYLDENTIATEGITDINDEFFMNEEGKRDSHEDYLRPHGNQEDSEGKTMPDSWSNSEKLEEGKIYYQLSPLFSDGNQDTKSSYFTDEETVNACRDGNGMVSVSTLLQKLQIEAKKEVVQYDNENKKEVYVNRYVLSSYVYTERPTD